MSKDDDFYHKFRSLRDAGTDGQDIINELITDDWGAPPSGIRVVGTLEDGTHVDEYAACRTRRQRR